MRCPYLYPAHPIHASPGFSVGVDGVSRVEIRATHDEELDLSDTRSVNRRKRKKGSPHKKRSKTTKKRTHRGSGLTRSSGSGTLRNSSPNGRDNEGGEGQAADRLTTHLPQPADRRRGRRPAPDYPGSQRARRLTATAVQP